MPQPNSNPHIISPPAVQGQQPYDAASDADVGPWVKPEDISELANGLPGTDAGPWKQV